MTCGLLEAQITVPTGGHSVTVAITGIAGSPFVATVAAGTYYPTEYLAAWKAALDAVSGADGTFTVSADLTDRTGTGLVTIAHTGQTFTITWTSTAARDILGFTGTLTPAALTFTGTAHLRGAFLPDAVIDSEHGAASAPAELDRSSLVTATGAVSSLTYGIQRVPMSTTRWVHLTHPKAKIAGGGTSHGSLEAWLLDTHGGTLSYFSASPRVRVYHDAGGSPIGTYRLIWDGRFPGKRADASWIYLWDVTLPPGFEV